MARRLYKWYDGALRTAPLRTKVATSFTILTSADVIRQAFFENPPPSQRATTADSDDIRGGTPAALAAPDWWDTDRTARMALFSCTLHPVWIHHWFNFLEHWRPSAALSAPTSVVLKVRRCPDPLPL